MSEIELGLHFKLLGANQMWDVHTDECMDVDNIYTPVAKGPGQKKNVVSCLTSF